MAAKVGKLDVVEYLLSQGFCTDVNSPLLHAVYKGHAKIVEALLHYDCSPEIHERALWSAVERGKTDVVRILVEYRPEIDRSRYFILAAKKGLLDIVGILQTTALLQQHLDKALYEAADHQHVDVVKFLLREMGADPNAEGPE